MDPQRHAPAPPPGFFSSAAEITASSWQAARFYSTKCILGRDFCSQVQLREFAITSIFVVFVIHVPFINPIISPHIVCLRCSAVIFHPCVFYFEFVPSWSVLLRSPTELLPEAALRIFLHRRWPKQCEKEVPEAVPLGRQVRVSDSLPLAYPWPPDSRDSAISPPPRLGRRAAPGRSGSSSSGTTATSPSSASPSQRLCLLNVDHWFRVKWESPPSCQ